MVQSGEAGGNLDWALGRLADYLEWEKGPSRQSTIGYVLPYNFNSSHDSCFIFYGVFCFPPISSSF